jgi:FkbM family methyltransferase
MNILIGRTFQIRPEIDYNHVWYGSAYGGFYVVPERLSDKSIVYSFGIGEDISFEKDIIEKHGCQVFGFDPTPKSISWVKQQQLPGNFTFQEYGIGTKTKDVSFNLPKNKHNVSGSVIGHDGLNTEDTILVPMRCFSDIVTESEHRRIDILKMDIEGSEFDVIDSILSSSVEISQILIELHGRFFLDGKMKIAKLLKVLKDNEYAVFAVSDSLEEVSFIKCSR